MVFISASMDQPVGGVATIHARPLGQALVGQWVVRRVTRRSMVIDSDPEWPGYRPGRQNEKGRLRSQSALLLGRQKTLASRLVFRGSELPRWPDRGQRRRP